MTTAEVPVEEKDREGHSGMPPPVGPPTAVAITLRARTDDELAWRWHWKMLLSDKRTIESAGALGFPDSMMQGGPEMYDTIMVEEIATGLRDVLVFLRREQKAVRESQEGSPSPS